MRVVSTVSTNMLPNVSAGEYVKGATASSHGAMHTAPSSSTCTR